MIDFSIFWADALFRSSLQAGGFALGVLLVFKLWKHAPANLKVWSWRLVIIKFFAVLLVPIGIERGSVVLSTGSSAKPLLPLVILFLSAILLLFSAVGLVLDLRKVRNMRNAQGNQIEYPNDLRCEVRESSEVEIPLLIGLGKPLILLPVALSQHPSELRMAVEHELAHLRRRDLTWSWPVLLYRAIFGFHPLSRLVLHELQVAVETACDEEAVLRSGVSRSDYGNLLIELSMQGHSMLIPSVGFASSCSLQTLRQRITSLALEPKRCHPAIIVAFAVATCLLVPGFRLDPPSPKPVTLDQTQVFSPAEKHPI